MRFSYYLPVWAVIIAILIAAGITVFFYLRLKHPITQLLRISLISLRFIAISIILCCLLAPVIIEKKDVTPPTHISVLVDTSSSMQLEDNHNGKSDTSRIEQVNQLLFGESSQFLQTLQKDYKVHIHSFDTSLNATQPFGDFFEAKGKLTDITNAVTVAEKNMKGHPTAGIILITDGAHNSSTLQLKNITDLKIPIYALGVGSIHPPKDILIQDIDVSPIAHTGHETVVRVTVAQTGYTTKTTRLSLREINTNKLIDAEIVSFEKDSSNQYINLEDQSIVQGTKHIIEFKVTPDIEGNIQYKVVLPSLEGELTNDNNEKTFSLKVIKAKLKIFYLEGRPRWDYTFLKRTLERDPDLETTFAVLTKKIYTNTTLARKDGYYPQQPTQQITPFPNTQQQLSKYDLLILGDLSDQHLTPKQQELIIDFIENRGKAVVFLPSHNALGRKGLRNTKLEQLLPIQIPPIGCREQKADFTLHLTQTGMYHPMMQLTDTIESNTEIWQNLPPLNRMYQGFQLKAGATSLIEIQNVTPILIFQRVGLGKCLFLAAEGIWNWDFGVQTFKNPSIQNVYPRFWAQVLRWMSQQSDDNRIYITTDSSTYNQGDIAKVNVNAYSSTFQPQDNVEIMLTVTSPNGSKYPLRTRAEGKDSTDSISGAYSAQFKVDEKGTYQLTANGRLDNIPLGEDNIEILVQPQLIELESPQHNENLLRKITEQTSGALLTIEDAKQIHEKINPVKNPVFIDEERDLWAHPLILIAIVGLLGTEWFLRKRVGLT